MDVIVVDLTHGGIIIAIKLAKLGYFNNIYAYDLYKTIKNQDKRRLLKYDIIIINDIDELNGNNEKELLISYPIHSPLKPNEIRKKTNYHQGLNLTHHKTVQFILKRWKKRVTEERIPIIEVTGVKGKTTTVLLLKSILKNYNPLILTSLGATLNLDDKTISLKKDISITPASILEAIDLANKINNSEHYISSSNTEKNKKLSPKTLDYKVAIFESSLGTSGVGDIGILTNIIENYKIAENTSNAKIAKKQVFNNEYVVIDYYTLIKFYPEKIRDKMNSFKLKDYSLYDDLNNKLNPTNTDIHPNLVANKVKYDLENSEIEIKYENIKTIYGNELSGELNVKTFVLGEHHVLNVLGAVTAALTLEIDEKTIKKGLKNFNPVEGRGSIQSKDEIKIIEEINPGLNVKSIEKTIDSIKHLENYSIIIGGKYGVTCEEINEYDLSKLLDKIQYEHDYDLTLVDELGRSLRDKMENKVSFFNDYLEAQKMVIKKGKNILLIYRSNYSQIDKR